MGFGNMLRGPWGGCGQHGGPFSKLILWRLNKKLNLTAEQRQELDALLLQLEEAYKAVEPGSRYFCESLFWASKPKQTAKTSRDRLCLRRPDRPAYVA
ncbi:hypothetical protein [Candidatus Reidiella endopervernicosa]|uniref:Uncharacterized protein n=1 Tax=Candidatus Reidiella endopervernicosa TaxID=2738883 RepID=A0A6N0I0C0_9GAMM|nr:hypothetical protein [Candidatus Reidiella endopervernicosa]QKQ28072.1 hypothetical protein HUE57_18615 [Candidatus Reidiella endopervernicosa]